MFEAGLNQFLPDILKQYSDDRPTLIFCSTRKSACKTAEYLLARCGRVRAVDEDHIGDNLLKKCLKYSIGFHHAGMTNEDRHFVEEMFKQGQLKALCCTSTLAVGVNLPARLVIVKSTMQYCGERGFVEYDDADVMQMVGRAGRPGHDSVGVAVIMTDLSMVRHYQGLCSGNSLIDSHFLETNSLIHHLNSEIVLGNVYDQDSALQYVQSSFFHTRANKDPQRFGIADREKIAEYEVRVVLECVRILQDCQIVRIEESNWSVTVNAKVMSRYHLRAGTVKQLQSLVNEDKTGLLLLAIASLPEFNSEHRVIGVNRQVIEQIRKSPNTRYSQGCDAFILIQLCLADYDDCSFKPAVYQHAKGLTETAVTLLRALVEIALNCHQWRTAKTAIELISQLSCQTWKDSPKCLMQLPAVGKANSRTLARAGINSIQAVRECEASRLEVLLKRHSPFGTQLKASADALPLVGVFNDEASVRVHIQSGTLCRGHLFYFKDDHYEHASFRGLTFCHKMAKDKVSTIHVLFESHCGVDRLIDMDNDIDKNVSIQEINSNNNRPVEQNMPITPVSLQKRQMIKEITIDEPLGVSPCKRAAASTTTDCKHKCKNKQTCAHSCCKPVRTVKSKVDYANWLSTFTCKADTRTISAAIPLMPTTTNHHIEIVEEPFTRADHNALKHDTQDSLHSVLEALGY